jgi:hypothetical protein
VPFSKGKINMKKTILSIALLLALPAFGQTILTITTLSSAVSSTTQAAQNQKIVVASATGITAPTNLQPNTDLWIDNELMAVEAVSGTTITVRRGLSPSKASPHASGALVVIGPPPAFFGKESGAAGGDPQGSCTRGNLLYLPFINVVNSHVSDCVGGVWVTGVDTTYLTNTAFRLTFPSPGATAYTSINTNGTSVGATTVYCTEIDLPYNKYITGLAFLNGTTVTNDNRYSILYDSAGNILANGALAGVVTATSSVYQQFAFTTPYYAVGPARYFGCFQDSVGSDTVRMAITGVNDNELTKGQTGATFGTIPALTVPTSFTTAVGPYLYVY